MSTEAAYDLKIELSEEQRERIASNRARALDILKNKEIERQRREICVQATAAGTICGEPIGCDPDVLILRDVFGEYCCKACKISNQPDFDFVNKTSALSEYLLTQDNITMMKYITKENPRQPGWTPMRLYLRKHARERSLKRWGDQESLDREKERRRLSKLQRDDVMANEALEKEAVERHEDASLLLSSSVDIEEILKAPSAVDFTFSEAISSDSASKRRKTEECRGWVSGTAGEEGETTKKSKKRNRVSSIKKSSSKAIFTALAKNIVSLSSSSKSS